MAEFKEEFNRWDDEDDIRNGIVHQLGVPVTIIKQLRMFFEQIAYRVPYVEQPIVKGESAYLSTWYLRPEYHILEILAMLLVVGTISLTIGKLPDVPIFIRESSFADRLLGYIILCDYVFHIWCKFKSDNVLGFRNVMYLFVPCSISHFLMVFFVTLFPSWNTPRVNQYLLSCTIYPISACLYPDTEHCKIPFEYEHFWVQHTMLIFVPYYFLFSRLDVAEEYLSLWVVIQDWGLYAIETFLVMWPLSVISGVNINYVMSPPPGPAFVHSWGKFYRVPTVALYAGLMLITGWLLPRFIVFLWQFWPLRTAIIGVYAYYALRKILERVF